MTKDTRSFIADEYRPPGIRFQDPRNMSLNDIRQVLQHCYGRQAESGPSLAFRFQLFVGARRKHLNAVYPDPTNPGPKNADKNRRQKKDKGKQREDVLEGLLRIDNSLEPPTANLVESLSQPKKTPNVGEPSKQRNQKAFDPQTSGLNENDLVRIDMEQMLQLKNMGYEAVGPINGPNDGYPEYEVTTAIFQVLQSRVQTSPTRNEADLQMRYIEPEPAPNVIDPALLGQAEQHHQNEDINPALVSQAEQPQQYNDTSPMLCDVPPETVHPTEPPRHGQTDDPFHISCRTPEVDGIDRPTTPPNAEAGPNHHNKTPQKQLGKRGQANFSPQSNRQQRGNQKKKKITDDDRAALEAQNMAQSGSRRRKPTRRY
jgi:hypothetical protein